MILSQQQPTAWAGQNLFNPSWNPMNNTAHFDMFKADPMTALLFWQHQQHQQQMNNFMAAVAAAQVNGGLMFPPHFASSLGYGSDITNLIATPAGVDVACPVSERVDGDGGAALLVTGFGPSGSGSGSLSRRKQGLPRQSPHL